MNDHCDRPEEALLSPERKEKQYRERIVFYERMLARFPNSETFKSALASYRRWLEQHLIEQAAFRAFPL